MFSNKIGTSFQPVFFKSLTAQSQNEHKQRKQAVRKDESCMCMLSVCTWEGNAKPASLFPLAPLLSINSDVYDFSYRNKSKERECMKHEILHVISSHELWADTNYVNKHKNNNAVNIIELGLCNASLIFLCAYSYIAFFTVFNIHCKNDRFGVCFSCAFLFFWWIF